MTDTNGIEKLLRSARVIAVVGISDKPERASHRVAAYLQSVGYRIIPVNPTLSEVLGEKAFASLDQIPEPVDVVDIFRRSEEAGAVVDQAVAIGAKAVWMQDGVIDHAAAKRAADNGLTVVMDDCMLRRHKGLINN